MKLENKVAIVTGGAMGNGLGIVKTFLKYGAKVIIIDYSETVKETVSSLKKEGYEVEGYLCDIRDKDALKRVVEKIVDVYYTVDILVNNAGVAKLCSFEDMTDEIRDLHFDINLKGTWNVTRAVLPYMEKGAIVNLASVTGPMVADPGEVAYATTKAGLVGFTKALARELVDKHIRVNAILPGYIMTPMVEKIAKETDAKNPNAVIDGIASGIPMGRLGTILELGELAAFLGSDESSYITGSEFVIDGGSTLPETKTVGV